MSQWEAYGCCVKLELICVISCTCPFLFAKFDCAVQESTRIHVHFPSPPGIHKHKQHVDKFLLHYNDVLQMAKLSALRSFPTLTHLHQEMIQYLSLTERISKVQQILISANLQKIQCMESTR